jgi:hypothetical protein
VLRVSTTSDPTGDYWQYEFKTSDDFFTDYGKIGIWPDAYYVSFNMFGPDGAVKGGAYAFDRAAMLAGAPAGMIAFDTGEQTACCRRISTVPHLRRPARRTTS